MNVKREEMTFETRLANRAVIYRSELDYLRQCILERSNIETGGQLFGFWTRQGVAVVLFVLGPGPKANHQVAFFNQDLDYLVQVGGALVSRYGLSHIGEWHSHHQLGLAQPSGHDAETMSSVIRERNLGRFLMALGNCTPTEATVNAFEFTQANGANFRPIPWDVKEFKSPFRELIEKDLGMGGTGGMGAVGGIGATDSEGPEEASASDSVLNKSMIKKGE